MIYNMSYARDYVVAGRSFAKLGKPTKAPAQAPLPPEEQPFDPNELSRRLYVVLAEQKREGAGAGAGARAAEGSSSSKGRGFDFGGSQPKTGSLRSSLSISNSESSGSQQRAGPAKQKPGTSSSSSGKEQPQQQPAPKATDAPGGPLAGLKALRSKSQRKASSSSKTATAGEGEEQPRQPWVPREAAAQFTRTTTVMGIQAVGMRERGLAHRLPKGGLKAHLEASYVAEKGLPSPTGGPPMPMAVAGSSGGGSSYDRTKPYRKSSSQRERLYNQTHFRQLRVLEEAAEMDEEMEAAAAIAAVANNNNTTKSNNNYRHHQHRHTFDGVMGPRPATATRLPEAANPTISVPVPLTESNLAALTADEAEQPPRGSLVLEAVAAAGVAEAGVDEPSKDKEGSEEEDGKEGEAGEEGEEEGEEEEEDVIDPKQADEHRVDWTQSDERAQKPRHHRQLRARMSVWIIPKVMRGDFGSGSGSGSEPSGSKPVATAPTEKQRRRASGTLAPVPSAVATTTTTTTLTTTITAAPPPKSPRSRFFSKFKH